MRQAVGLVSIHPCFYTADTFYIYLFHPSWETDVRRDMEFAEWLV